MAAYREALARRSPWPEAQENLTLIQSLIPVVKKEKRDDEQNEEAPDLPPDETKFDEKGKRGKRTQMKADPTKMADIWMRNIQTTPADFLRRRFAIQAAEDRRR